jgi:hypothetical protein
LGWFKKKVCHGSVSACSVRQHVVEGFEVTLALADVTQVLHPLVTEFAPYVVSNHSESNLQGLKQSATEDIAEA